MKERWGTYPDTGITKLKANESDMAKKKYGFLDYFFFYRSLKMVHLHLGLLRGSRINLIKKIFNTFYLR